MTLETSAHMQAQAAFAGGCFWCMQQPYDTLPGVQQVVVGYMGGSNQNPTYENFARYGHREVAHILFDPEKTSYRDLLAVFWKNIDPTDASGQFADRGNQYKTAIFYYNDEQKRQSERSKKDLEASGKFSQPIMTEILKASEFYPAEEYHQAYYQKNPEQYASYKYRSGREPFLKKTWKDNE